MTQEELNDILLHDLPNVWSKHAYLRGWGSELKYYKLTTNIYECMETTEQVYKGYQYSKTTKRSGTNRDDFISKHKVGVSIYPMNTQKGTTDKFNKNYADNLRSELAITKVCMVHNPGHSMDEHKLLQQYS